MGKIISSTLGVLTGSSAYKSQASAMKKAAKEQEKQTRLAQEQVNAANAKTPDIDTIRQENSQGVGSTMLTGAGGIDDLDSHKKKKTLLGE